MQALRDAILLIERYKNMPLEQSVKEFEEFTGQVVPEKAISEYKFIGLHNVDFYVSNYLNNYSVRNLLQFFTHKDMEGKREIFEQLYDELKSLPKYLDKDLFPDYNGCCDPKLEVNSEVLQATQEGDSDYKILYEFDRNFKMCNSVIDIFSRDKETFVNALIDSYLISYDRTKFILDVNHTIPALTLSDEETCNVRIDINSDILEISYHGCYNNKVNESFYKGDFISGAKHIINFVKSLNL